ncbi:NADH-quinone oxidoreductase subunit NuoN [Schaalia vaccimaxillae]|uniref:NADH-quinone oxidoreductase subunit NuoN n=1 Tax=Schaalia vaccimaxillae TaxID=183916 RepID=UPI0003B4C29D|nr:NADH-quinone oxidoreductase subunit NuoN [Schaalia vaccimaxillae]
MNLLPAVEFVEPTVQYATLVPVGIILAGAVIALLIETFAPAKARRMGSIIVALVATLASAVVLVSRWFLMADQASSIGEYIEDHLTIAAQLILVIIGFLAILVVADRTQVGDGAFVGQPADRPGSSDEELTDSKNYQRSEVFTLMLFSLVGMMLFPAADSYIVLFVALEVMSLPLYIMAATARYRRQLSQEAGIKYFILGAFASGFMLMGSALLYGFSGSLIISDMHAAVVTQGGMDMLAVAGVLLVMVGLLFKVGAAPFHAWTPDVYTGAPTPITGFMAAAVKVAAFGAMIRFYQVVAAALQWDLVPVLVAVAVMTMVVGTFVGVVQKDVKRMLAFSSIAHAGFILIGVFSLVQGSTGHVLLYVLTYGLATIGAFGVISLVRRKDSRNNIMGEATHLDQWAGLGKTSPLLATSMLIFLLSFAGIPLTAGFVGKFVVFSDGFAGGMGWLVALALLCSAVTAFFYFRLVRQMFFAEPAEGVVAVNSEGFGIIAIAITAVATVVLGVFPGPVLSVLDQVAILLP